MCGIAGALAYSESAPPVEDAWLLRVRDYMAARGPDGAGLWVSHDRRIGLAHRRLAIIDTSGTGMQPMAADEGNLQITFNGEIYNYLELRRELEMEGVQFRSRSDTEVLLHLYRKRGADMVHALRGMFAFAIWDARNKGLFLARDPFGIKPLYYSDDGRTFRFASQVKALLAGGEIDTTAEEAGHAGFFLWGYVPDPFTLYKGIRALQAGTSLWLGCDSKRREIKFFSIQEEFKKAEESPFQGTPQAANDLACQAIKSSVASHLIADVPVGIFLSAGLDSSNITGFAAGLAGSRLRTMTLGFSEFAGTKGDETILAEAVARRFNTRHDTRFISRSDFRSTRDHLLASMDQPSIDGVNTYFISKLAADLGLKVALSGLGGDELFGTYPSFRDVPRLAHGLSFARHLRWLGRFSRRVLAPLLKTITSPKYAGLLEYGGTYSGAYMLRRGLFMPWELKDLIGSSWSREGLKSLESVNALQDGVAELHSRWARVSACEHEWYMRCQLLRDADWAGMAHSLEIRVPFVDTEVFKTLARIQCSPVNVTKRDIANAFNPQIPKQVLLRSKTGFSVPIREWLHIVSPNLKPARGLREWAKIVDAEATIVGARERFKKVRRVLIYRLGSLGDTVVALPCFHLAAKIFSSSERKVLTNFPVSTLAPPLEAILGSSGLVHGYISYPQKLRGFRPSLDLLREIRKWKPQVLIYLTAPRGLLSVIRDALFFRFCGIRVAFGIPYMPTQSRNRRDFETGLFEQESIRLARTLQNLGHIDLNDVRNWQLSLSKEEINTADDNLLRGTGGRPFIACSVGTKVEVKDWGEDNWVTLVRKLAVDYSKYALVFIGAKEDWERSERIRNLWKSASVNLCGILTPRETAATLRHAVVFIGHDSGPMHLAASMGVRTVSIFSARELPGVWYPIGAGHQVLYHKTKCFGCRLDICATYAKECILSITADEVALALKEILP